MSEGHEWMQRYYAENRDHVRVRAALDLALSRIEVLEVDAAKHTEAVLRRLQNEVFADGCPGENRQARSTLQEILNNMQGTQENDAIRAIESK